jgi:hypothetical protein
MDVTLHGFSSTDTARPTDDPAAVLLRASGGKLKKAFLQAESAHPLLGDGIEQSEFNRWIRISRDGGKNHRSSLAASGERNPSHRIGGFRSATDRSPARSTRYREGDKSRPSSVLDFSQEREKEEKAIRRQRFAYLAKEDAALQAGSATVQTSLQRMSVGTLIPGGKLRMCLTSHLIVTIRIAALPVYSILTNTVRIRVPRPRRVFVPAVRSLTACFGTISVPLLSLFPWRKGGKV